LIQALHTLGGASGAAKQDEEEEGGGSVEVRAEKEFLAQAS
jgi:hypothetical protein